jgi:hypothetical protein
VLPKLLSPVVQVAQRALEPWGQVQAMAELVEPPEEQAKDSATALATAAGCGR